MICCSLKKTGVIAIVVCSKTVIEIAKVKTQPYPNFFFIDCHVLICDFHREQAWERWMKRSENSMGESREEALDLMRAVAKAATDEAFEVALNRLQDSDVYQKNPQFQKYFGNTWLSEKEVRMHKRNH